MPASGTLAGEKLPPGLLESGKLEPAIFSPATKAESGHDENITVATDARDASATRWPTTLESMARAVYTLGEKITRDQGIIIADTKFEFGRDGDGRIILIDEVMTPDSSRFWAADVYKPGQPQPSFDKQPLRDYLDVERRAGRWNGEAPPPPLPASVVDATSKRYLEAYRRVTGAELKIAAAFMASAVRRRSRVRAVATRIEWRSRLPQARVTSQPCTVQHMSVRGTPSSSTTDDRDGQGQARVVSQSVIRYRSGATQRRSTTFSAAAAASVLTVTFGLSYSLLIFAGPLAPFLSYGVAATFVSSAVLAAVIALGSSFPFAIAGPESSTAAMTGILASSLVERIMAADPSAPLLAPVLHHAWPCDHAHRHRAVRLWRIADGACDPLCALSGGRRISRRHRLPDYSGCDPRHHRAPPAIRDTAISSPTS